MLTRVIINAVPHLLRVSIFMRRWAGRSAYFDLPDQPMIIDHNSYSIDDDLHQELDLEHPEEQDAKQHRDAVHNVSAMQML